jgi:hypothetical protein
MSTRLFRSSSHCATAAWACATLVLLAGCSGGGSNDGSAGPAPAPATPAPAQTAIIHGRIDAVAGHAIELSIDGTPVAIAADGRWQHAIDLASSDGEAELTMTVDGAEACRRRIRVGMAPAAP